MYPDVRANYTRNTYFTGIMQLYGIMARIGINLYERKSL